MNIRGWASTAQRRLLVRELWRKLAALLVPYRADEAVAATFRARQLQAVLRLMPFTILASVTNAATILSLFWGRANRVFLVTWALVIAVFVLRGLRAHFRAVRRPPKRTASVRATRVAARNVSITAVLWSIPPLVLMPDANGPQQVLLIAAMTAMICAGGFALATTPVAATLFVLISGASMTASLFRAHFALAWGGAAMAITYVRIVIGCVWSTARMFGAQMMAEAEAERQTAVVGLLLRDFEENASDALWEVDGGGRLCRVSPKLAALFGASIEYLTDRPLLALLQAMAAEADACSNGTGTGTGTGVNREIEAIERNLLAGTPFRDLPLAVKIDSRTCWWTLTAKPLHDDCGRAIGWRGVAADVTEAEQASRRLTWLAHFDLLTGLANRHELRTRLAELLAPTSGGPPGFALLCLDLDHFKIINDTLGHAVGDGLLREVARRLRETCRPGDIVARLGGDEFAVVLPGVATPTVAERLAQALVDSLAVPCEVQGSRITTRVSIGIALAPCDGSDIDSLLNHADLALYAAKAAGRGKFRTFRAEMATVNRRRLQIEQALRGALARGEMWLAFQPQVDFALWRVTGFEALLRWRHPELGEVSPAEFIPVAEETREIQAIGEWVLMQACREATRWPDGLSVSVNVSPVQAMTEDLCAVAQAALHQTGLLAARLELEITESIFLNENGATMDVLRSLRAVGIRIALDDFGTGYSSLAYLRRFPFDTLKIDRSFVREIGLRRDLRAIVKMIIGLARTLGMRTVAEGVENELQASVLRRYGCDQVQGYMVAKPMPAAEIAEFLGDWIRFPPSYGQETVQTGLLPLTEQVQ